LALASGRGPYGQAPKAIDGNTHVTGNGSGLGRFSRQVIGARWILPPTVFGGAATTFTSSCCPLMAPALEASPLDIRNWSAGLIFVCAGLRRPKKIRPQTAQSVVAIGCGATTCVGTRELQKRRQASSPMQRPSCDAHREEAQLSMIDIERLAMGCWLAVLCPRMPKRLMWRRRAEDKVRTWGCDLASSAVGASGQ
jgi:hypothetical protein